MKSFVGTLLVTITCIVSVYSLKCTNCENPDGLTCPEKSVTIKDCPDADYQCGTSYYVERRGNKTVASRIVKGCKKKQECTTSPATTSNSNVAVAFGVACCTSENCTVPDISNLFPTSRTANKHTCTSCFSESLEQCQATEQMSCYGNETQCGRILIDFGGSIKNHWSMRGCANPEFCAYKLVTPDFKFLVTEKDCYVQCKHCENSTGLTCLEKSETIKDCPDSDHQCATSYFVEKRGEKTVTSWSVKGCKKTNECTTSPATISNSNVSVAFGAACCANNSCTIPDISNLFPTTKTANKHTCTSCFSESLKQCQATEQMSCYGNETQCGRISIAFGGSIKNHWSMRGCANPEFCSQKLVTPDFKFLVTEKDCYVQCKHCENSTGLTCLEKSETIKDCPDSDHQCATSYFIEKKGEKTVASWSVKGCKKTNECTTSPATIRNSNVAVAFGVVCCANNSCTIPDKLFPTTKTTTNLTCTSCYSNSIFQCSPKENIKCYGAETKCGRLLIDSAGAVDEHWSMRGCANQEFCSSNLVDPRAKFNILTSKKKCTDSSCTHKLSVLILTVAVFWTLLF